MHLQHRMEQYGEWFCTLPSRHVPTHAYARNLLKCHSQLATTSQGKQANPLPGASVRTWKIVNSHCLGRNDAVANNNTLTFSGAPLLPRTNAAVGLKEGGVGCSWRPSLHRGNCRALHYCQRNMFRRFRDSYPAVAVGCRRPWHPWHASGCSTTTSKLLDNVLTQLRAADQAIRQVLLMHKCT